MDVETTGNVESISQAGRSVGDGKQRRRRGDRSKGDKNTRVKKTLPKLLDRGSEDKNYLH